MFQATGKLLRRILGPTVIELEYQGKKYQFLLKGRKSSEVERWFLEYAPKAPVCVGCDRIILPYTPVSKVTPGTVIGGRSTLKEEIPPGLAHNAYPCIPCSNFIGWIGDDGQLIPAFPDGLSAEEMVLKTNKPLIIPDLDELGPRRH